ncbi:MAG: polysaccharide biosynthesis/export family protein [Candidatus Methylomirabilales bacterium]
MSGRLRTLFATASLLWLLLAVVPLLAAEYVIGAADVLFISVLGNKDLDTVSSVTPGGKISFPLVGDVQAAGLTAEELADRLARALSEKIKSPVVSVSLREINSYRVYVLGGVARPGVLSSKSEITLLQALALAGGVTPGADLALGYVARGNRRLDADFRKLVMQGDLSQNIILKPEDVVVVPASPKNAVFVMGEVRNPGTIPLEQESGYTILQVLARAGGFSQFAKPSRTVIIREEGSGKQIIPVDVQKIIDNPQGAKDVVLKPGDVVFVPQGGLF